MSMDPVRVKAGADSATRDRSGRRQGGERGPASMPLVWASIALIIVGFTLGAISIPAKSWTLFIAGMVIFVLSGLGSLAAGVMRATK